MRVTMKLIRASSSGPDAERSSRRLETKWRVRDGGVSAHANSVSSRFTRVSSVCVVVDEEAALVEALAVGQELGRADRHRVLDLGRKQLQPRGESVGVEQLRLVVEELEHAAVLLRVRQDRRAERAHDCTSSETRCSLVMYVRHAAYHERCVISP